MKFLKFLNISVSILGNGILAYFWNLESHTNCSQIFRGLVVQIIAHRLDLRPKLTLSIWITKTVEIQWYVVFGQVYHVFCRQLRWTF